MKLKINYLLASSIIFSLLLLHSALALEISPSSITEEIPKGEYKMVPVTVSNNQNSTKTFTIVSQNKDLVETGMTVTSLDPNSDITFNLFLYGNSPGQSSTNVNIETNTTQSIPVTVTVPEENKGHLEPTFSTVSKNFEVGVDKTRSFSVRNLYDEKIEMVGIDLRGDTVITNSGQTKPVQWEGELGYLDAGKDLTVDINYNTKNIDPGSYSVTMILSYYVGGERQTSDINFNINVIKSLTPNVETESGEELKQMDIELKPENPKPQDYISVRLLNARNTEPIEGNITVDVKDLQGKKLTTFDYTYPFQADAGKEYCVNGESKGYNATTKCLDVMKVSSKVKLSPENPDSGDSVQIQCLSSAGGIISNATIEVGNETINSPQTTLSFNEGEYDIECRAKGYVKSQKTLKISEALEILNESYSKEIGGNISVAFNREAKWEVVRNNKVIDSGTAEEFTYTIEQGGNYDIFVEGNKVKSFEVGEGLSLPSMPNFGNIQLEWIILIIIGLAVLWKRSYIFDKMSGIPIIGRFFSSKDEGMDYGWTPQGTSEKRVVVPDKEERQRGG